MAVGLASDTVIVLTGYLGYTSFLTSTQKILVTSIAAFCVAIYAS